MTLYHLSIIYIRRRLCIVRRIGTYFYYCSSYYIRATCNDVYMYYNTIVRLSVGGRPTSSVNYQLPSPINWNCPLSSGQAAIITIIIPSSYLLARIFMYITHIHTHIYARTLSYIILYIHKLARERAVHPLNPFKLLTNCPPDGELCAISSASTLRRASVHRVYTTYLYYNVYFTYFSGLLLVFVSSPCI